uniref:Cysteine dioxygenase n=1 Tax=Sus scrofa TaxID=9823 RepID=A0A8D1SMK5_PIG
MEQTEVLKPRTLADLIRILHQLFASEEANVEEVQAVMEAYESDPAEWAMYAKFDQYRYTRNLVDQGNGKFNLMILCWGEGHGSSIHDHTDSHCFLKMLQGNLKETLFAWPDKKSNEMIKKSERILRENQCAYINGNIQSIFLTASGKNLQLPSKVLLTYTCALELGSWNHDFICLEAVGCLVFFFKAWNHLLKTYAHSLASIEKTLTYQVLEQLELNMNLHK